MHETFLHVLRLELSLMEDLELSDPSGKFSPLRANNYGKDENSPSNIRAQ
jgi:hypothetical protein